MRSVVKDLKIPFYNCNWEGIFMVQIFVSINTVEIISFWSVGIIAGWSVEIIAGWSVGIIAWSVGIFAGWSVGIVAVIEPKQVPILVN